MRILAILHSYTPLNNDGGSVYAHTAFRYLIEQGHEVKVGQTRAGETYEHEGVEVIGDVREADVVNADLLVTHLDFTREAIFWARRVGRPLVHLVHNHRQLKRSQVEFDEAALVVFNSMWLARQVQWAGPFTILRPPVWVQDYRTTPGEALTLINCFQRKGAPTFFELARHMPKRKFVAVLGGYGPQVCPGDVRNVTYIDHTTDMRAVYAKTRVLLMPSAYESWGRTAIEAAASGIPTIASPTPGLVESLGAAGIYANPGDLDAWIERIERLDNPSEYARVSALALARSSQLNPSADLEHFERALLAVCRQETPQTIPA